MIEIRCPNCDSIGKISFSQRIYRGPYRCWKCRNIFALEVKNDILKSIKPISKDEFERWQEQQKTEKWRLDSKQEKD